MASELSRLVIIPAGAPILGIAAFEDIAHSVEPWTIGGDARHPAPELLAQRIAEQAAILAEAQLYLKPGGTLVYITCSILPEENEQVVEAFLAAHPGFALKDCAEVLAHGQVALDTGKYLRLYPHVHGTDGFFAAVMEKCR